MGIQARSSTAILRSSTKTRKSVNFFLPEEHQLLSRTNTSSAHAKTTASRKNGRAQSVFRFVMCFLITACFTILHTRKFSSNNAAQVYPTGTNPVGSHGHVQKNKMITESNNGGVNEGNQQTEQRRQRVALRESQGIQKLQSLLQVHQSGGNVSTCLTPACIKDEASKIARAFPDRTDRENWCIAEHRKSNQKKIFNAKKQKDTRLFNHGILLSKVNKAASSTAAGAAVRLSRHLGCHDRNTHVDHRTSISYSERDPRESFLFAPIRDPGSRAMSRIFYDILPRRKDIKPEDDRFIIDNLMSNDQTIRACTTKGQGGFSLRYTSLVEIPEYSCWHPSNRNNVRNPDQVISRVKDVIDAYDFLMVTERMDESLVAMSLIMGIDVGDVFVTSSKKGNDYVYVPRPAGSNPTPTCYKSMKKVVSPAVQNYLDSNEYRAMNYGDLVLHEAAKQCLDLTIDRIGRNRFDVAMTKYQRLKKRVAAECDDDIVLPCSAEGIVQTELSGESW